MYKKLKMLLKDESGITALETAIILIAFVVVASVFAFTILSAGTFSTERGKEAIYAGLEEVSSSMELKGGIIAQVDSAGDPNVKYLKFTLGIVSGGDSVNITDTSNSKNVVVIAYRDGNEFHQELDWTLSWITQDDTDDLLEEGELVQIVIDLSSQVSSLGTNTEFALEVKPPQGAVLNFERTTPAYLDKVMDLH